MASQDALRQQECYLAPHRPVGTDSGGPYYVIEGCHVGVERQLAYPEDLPRTQTEGHGPLIGSWCFPVGRDNRGGGDVPFLLVCEQTAIGNGS